MHRSTKQTNQNNSNFLTIALIVITFAAVIFGMGQYEDAQMARYAQANNCTWSATGTFYGDSRDFICN